MCGRFAQNTELIALLNRFRFLVSEDVDYRPRYNIAPSQTVPVIVQEAPDRRVLCGMRWGLIPAWADDPAIGNRLINARSETAATKPAFRSAFARRRCVAPASGFYEWKRLAKGGGRKQPYFFRLADGAPMALAGLWEVWSGPDGGAVRSFTILTTEANERVKSIHDRMPVILPPEHDAPWLDLEVGDTTTLQALLRPYPAAEMESYPVAPVVNSPANDTPACIAPIDQAPPEEGMLF